MSLPIEKVYLDEHEQVSRVVGVNVDITERKLAEATKEQNSKDQLQFKDDVLSHVSHELRAPLSAIKQFTTIFLDGLAGELTKEQREYHEIVLKNIVQLQSMIDDLLEVTRIDGGRLSVEPERMSVAGPVADVADTLRGAALLKGVRLSTDVASALPRANADPTRVRQILIILVDNAIKFSAAGGEVTIRARRSDVDPEALLMEVIDNGPGIAPEVAEKVFDRLYQVSNSTRSGRKGLGLGLFICKELVSRQGGQIRVTSELGKGSTFAFTLPLFSFKKLVAPLFRNGRWPSGAVALLTVEPNSVDEQPLGEDQEQWSSEARGLVQLCLLPHQGVLLPRNTLDADAGRLFVVAFTSKDEAPVLARKIEEQGDGVTGRNEPGLRVSITMLKPPLPEAGAPAESVIASMAAYLEKCLPSTTATPVMSG